MKKTRIMNKTYSVIFALLISLCTLSCNNQPKLDLKLSSKFDGQGVELISLLDSTIIASGVLNEGEAILLPQIDMPQFTTVVIDGRIRGYYISEPGDAFMIDSISSAMGTPLNDRFTLLLNQLDSVEQYDDMNMYLDFVEKTYNENKVNPIGSYFGIEWLKYAEPEKVDSMLAEAPLLLRESPKAEYYKNFARLRALTSPGQPYVDIEGENEDGTKIYLSEYIPEGKYVLLDFWASWCPYCIKELPEMTGLYNKWKGQGLEIVGVAVRDLPDDTKGAISKHGISWPVIYNTQRNAYNAYGFSGIPHHVLIGPDGKIISRGENVAKIDERLQEIIQIQE